VFLARGLVSFWARESRIAAVGALRQARDSSEFEESAEKCSRIKRPIFASKKNGTFFYFKT
jgi:hypothetical protein